MRPRFREVTIICTDEDHPRHRGMIEFNVVSHLIRLASDRTEVFLVNGASLVVEDDYETLVRYCINQSR